MAKDAKRVDDAYTSNDVGQWGDAKELSYGEPFKIAGETVELEKLPKFGGEASKAKAPLPPIWPAAC